ncbi:MAG: hypothetical protein MUO26_00275 [Methanotrichaceae archaeon]|nr:hypothetical protein [Methanotrichaceae archaeon]
MDGIFWLSNRSDTFPASVVVIVGVLLTIIIIILLFTAHEAFVSSQINFPAIISVKVVDNITLFLLEPSELFNFGIGVSFYYKEDSGFESLIGVGYVANVQNDKKIQVALAHPDPVHNDKINQLTQDPNIQKRVLVKPIKVFDIR